MQPTDTPTIKIQDGDGEDFIVINRTDFKPDVHKEWKPPALAKPKNPEKTAGGDPAANGSTTAADSPPPAKPEPPAPWVLRAHIKDDLAAAMEAKGFVTPEKIVSASEDELMNLKMGRRLAAQVKKAAAAWVDQQAAATAAAQQ